MKQEIIERLDTSRKKNWFLRHIKFTLIAIILIITAVAVMLGNALYSSYVRQNEMQAQLDMQNDVINALRDKEDDTDAKDKATVITSETIKTQLAALSELVTQEYVYTNADKRETSETWIFGWTRPFSSNHLLITYDGIIKAGIDINEASVDVDEESKTITVNLPASRITDNNIPQESITVLEVKNGLFNEVTFDDYNDFIADQKLIMEQKAIDQGILTNADKEARALINSFLSVLPGIDSYKIVIN